MVLGTCTFLYKKQYIKWCSLKNLYLVLSSQSASMRKLLTTANDWPPSSQRMRAVDIKLGTWLGSTSNAFWNDFGASWWRPLALKSKPNKSPSYRFLNQQYNQIFLHMNSEHPIRFVSKYSRKRDLIKLW